MLMQKRKRGDFSPSPLTERRGGGYRSRGPTDENLLLSSTLLMPGEQPMPVLLTQRARPHIKYNNYSPDRRSRSPLAYTQQHFSRNQGTTNIKGYYS